MTPRLFRETASNSSQTILHINEKEGTREWVKAREKELLWKLYLQWMKFIAEYAYAFAVLYTFLGFFPEPRINVCFLLNYRHPNVLFCPQHHSTAITITMLFSKMPCPISFHVTRFTKKKNSSALCGHNVINDGNKSTFYFSLFFCPARKSA